jgi:hypothetical protein
VSQKVGRGEVRGDEPGIRTMWPQPGTAGAEDTGRGHGAQNFKVINLFHAKEFVVVTVLLAS